MKIWITPEVLYKDNELRIETTKIPDKLALSMHYLFPEEQKKDLLPF